jgi:hypothetical protein
MVNSIVAISMTVLLPWAQQMIWQVQSFHIPKGFPATAANSVAMKSYRWQHGMIIPNYQSGTFISSIRDARKLASAPTSRINVANKNYDTNIDHANDGLLLKSIVRGMKSQNAGNNTLIDGDNGNRRSTTNSSSICAVESDDTDSGNAAADEEKYLHRKTQLATKLNPKSQVTEMSQPKQQQQLRQQQEEQSTVQCRIVASADGKIPQLMSDTVNANGMAMAMADKIDSIYSAIHNKQLKNIESFEDYRQHNISSIQMIKDSLSSSGFQLLSKRDMDLCKALNEGYILRLSIAPDLKDLDPNLYHEFYGNESNTNVDQTRSNDLLFNGKILVFRRGYGQEVTSGRLILPKLDYLQSSIVQRSAYNLVKEIEKIERNITQSLVAKYHDFQSAVQSTLDSWKIQMNSRLGDDRVKMQLEKGVYMIQNATKATGNSLNGTLKGDRKAINIKLKRYVGGEGRVRFVDSSTDEMDALSPFLVCEMDTDNQKDQEHDIEKDLQRGINAGVLACKYDMAMTSLQRDSNGLADDFTWNDYSTAKRPTHLLNRISIANLVNFFSKGGRRRLIKSLFAVSELVEPTYEEVVLVWRPLPKMPKVKKVILPPKFVYDIFEIFELEHKLPQPPEPEPIPDPPALEIRAFGQVPMANLFAVLPKTKLIFRPADALIFDLVNVFSFLAVVASQKFDSPKLDFIALVSVCVWFLRTFFRYSNKIARYDLLVNKFLTKSISHRNTGAFRYIVSESATQRARRATLMHDWLAEETLKGRSLQRDDIVDIGPREVMKRLNTENPICIDVNSALDDLVALDLIEFDDVGNLMKVKTGSDADKALLTIWKDILL